MGYDDLHNIGDAFLRQAGKQPRKTALIFLGTGYSYDLLKRLALSFAHYSAEKGIRPGDRVIIYLPNSPQWVVAWLGCMMLGAVAVPITPIYMPHDLDYIANDSGARAIVCMDTNYGYVTQVLPDTRLRLVIHTNIADLLPLWKRVFGTMLNKIPKGKVAQEEFSVPFRRVIRSAPTLPEKPECSDEEMAVLLYTGGTTKDPKGVPITHRIYLEDAPHQIQVSEALIPRGENIILQGAPLFHVLGQVLGMLPLCLFGDTLLLLPRVNLDGMMNVIQRHRAKSLVGVPVLYRMILEHDRLDYYDLSSLVYCFTGGDVLPTEVGRRWKERFGVPIYQGYGATETAGGVSISPPNEEYPIQAMGRILSNKTARIVDQESLQEVSSGTPGELLVNSDPMVTSYWNKPEETREAFVEMDGMPWYRTGDIVSMDQAGFVYFVDRTVDTIKHKGYRVSASEIEAVLQEHPSVMASCVVGLPDPKVGNRIKAFVVLKEDIKGMTGYDLIRWCRKKLVSYKIPHYIEFRDMLPKSKVGKLLRREVRSDEQKRTEKGKWDEALDDAT